MRKILSHTKDLDKVMIIALRFSGTGIFQEAGYKGVGNPSGS